MHKKCCLSLPHFAMLHPPSTIAAIASPAGTGAIAIVRMSGNNSLGIADKILALPQNKTLKGQKTYTLHYGKILCHGRVLDEVVAAVFCAPHSYTGEDMVEIYCHGSVYIQQQILQTLIDNGAAMAQPGEFTMRAFLNKKIDLPQAEAVEALIASQTAEMHRIAMQQMRGGYSAQLKALREELLNFVSLVELELDFAEENVEFADRREMQELIGRITAVVEGLAGSFAEGSAIKQGTPVAIAGKPNAGKSTLFNALLNDECALVSPIAGTTRDAIDGTITIGGVLFRLIDTAGLRTPADHLEQMGIERSRQKIGQARIVLWLADCGDAADAIASDVLQFADEITSRSGKIILLLNKIDLMPDVSVKDKIKALQTLTGRGIEVISVSGKYGSGLQTLQECLVQMATQSRSEGYIVSNARHYQALVQCRHSLVCVRDALNGGLGGELIAFEARKAIDCISGIVGDITDADVLNNIFSRFCIGK